MSRAWPWLALGLALRALFALKLGGRQYQIDELAFVSAAKQGMAGIVMPPVPVYFYKLFFLLGASWLWPRLAQAVVSTATAWMIGRWGGRKALAIACVYPFFVYYSGILMSETLYLFFVTLALWQLERRAILAGLAFGLAALCRAEAAFIALPILLLHRSRLPLLLACLIPVTAWCARNKRELGAFTLDLHGGMTLLHGNEFFALNEQDTLLAQREIEKTPEFQAAVPIPEKDALLKKRALRWIAANPGTAARQWARKAVNFWRFYPRPEKTFIESEHSRPAAGAPRWALTAVSLLFEPALIILGLWGAWLRRAQWPLLLWIAGTMGLHVLSVSQMRYRLPVMPVLIVFAAAALSRRSDSAR